MTEVHMQIYVQVFERDHFELIYLFIDWAQLRIWSFNFLWKYLVNII